ncbi:thiamine pyrophosphate-binding protein [Propylenella binzhouense]|uniref:Thiamine pyrophosphate-binding protein n=1 Tax=Propylenella binzhouense TaxID=2555902 RepID=A0A964T1V3_9HYPH|nr:thiamine pyrophosphate-binding protein [Propylenella binzhouense]MYZ46861.1 thiamine pyrophosphate-binding protein [Propylenella binzhouense]
MPTSVPIYVDLAKCFATEGVKAHFALMGDGNMHFFTAFKNVEGVQSVFVRHEHCACAMASGYYCATGNLPLVSVSCGPALTQIMTALVTAAQARTPMVILAGETPLGVGWHLQAIEQRPFVAASDCIYISGHDPRRIHDYVRDAVFQARRHLKPVVLGIPYDLQQLAVEEKQYRPAPKLAMQPPVDPDPSQVRLAAERLRCASFPVVLAGRGVVLSQAEKSVERLADKTGALLATTLPMRGLFDHHPFSIGIAGGYARDIAREMGEKADFVVAIGTSLNPFTLDQGKMFPKASVLSIDLDPAIGAIRNNLDDVILIGDAKLAVDAVTAALPDGAEPADIRSASLARRIADEPAYGAAYPVEPGELDPREVIHEIDAVIPKTYGVVSGSGHQSYFHTAMRNRRPHDYYGIREFGAIGNGISYAVGAALARGDGSVVLFDGDGSALMHIQELETIARHRIKLLICILNDGGYGSEFHKLRADGLDDSGAVFGRPNFKALAEGFGLCGATVSEPGQFRQLFDDYQRQPLATVWDIHISDCVLTPRMRSFTARQSETCGR